MRVIRLLLLTTFLASCASTQHLDDEGMLIYCIGVCAAIDTDRHHTGESLIKRKAEDSAAN